MTDIAGAAPGRTGDARPATGSSPRSLLAAAEIDLRLFGMLVALAAILIGFGIVTGGRMLNPTALVTLSIQTSIVAVMATGMVLVIVSRNIDLSIGSLEGVIAMTYALLMADWLPNILGIPVNSPLIVILTFAFGLTLGVAIGALQGFVIAYIGVPSFIVTLGGLLAFRGVTAAQRRAWIHGRLRPGSVTYQSSVFFRFEGDLDEGALRGALEELIDRHEIFRTSFEERGGEPVQVIHDRVGVPLETIDFRAEPMAAWPALVRRLVRVRIDPGEAPLARWTLVRLDERRWALVQIEHHLIHDGWSATVLTDELSELYSARVEGRPHRLPELEIQFQDFARWERTVAGSETVRRQLEHWEAVLDPAPPLLDLPADRPRPPRESFDGSSIRRRLEPAPAARLRAMALEGNATLFMVTFAAFLVQLRAYSGRDDLQVGSGIANRREKASERMIGMALNTVALRCNLEGDPTVRELLQRVRQVALDAYANVDAPFDAVVERLQPPRDPRRSPLIQTLFSFHDAPRSEERWAGLEAGLVQVVPNGTAKADLNLIGINDRDGGVTFVWEHSDLFADATADRLAGHHLHLLEQFVERPDARLSELAVSEDEELSADRALGNRPDAVRPRGHRSRPDPAPGPYGRRRDRDHRRGGARLL